MWAATYQSVSGAGGPQLLCTRSGYLVSVKRGLYTFAGKALVSGKLVAEAELKATFAAAG